MMGPSNDCPIPSTTKIPSSPLAQRIPIKPLVRRWVPSACRRLTTSKPRHFLSQKSEFLLALFIDPLHGLPDLRRKKYLRRSYIGCAMSCARKPFRIAECFPAGSLAEPALPFARSGWPGAYRTWGIRCARSRCWDWRRQCPRIFGPASRATK